MCVALHRIRLRSYSLYVRSIKAASYLVNAITEQEDLLLLSSRDSSVIRNHNPAVLEKWEALLAASAALQ